MMRKRQGKVGNKTLCTRIVSSFVLIALFGAVVIALAITKPAFAGTDTYPTSIAGCRLVSNPGGGSFPCDLKDSTKDKYIDPWGEYNRECTSYAAWMLHSVNGFEMPFHDNANNWGTRARNLGYTVNMTPEVGSIYWTTSHLGHVAWVESISSDGKTITIEDYNSDYTGHYAEHTGVASSSASGYIHFKDTSAGAATYVPAAISFKGALNVFKIGGDGQVYQNYWNGTKWNGWSSISGSTAVNNLAVIVNGSALNIFQLNANGQVYTEYNSGNGWSGWASLGGHQMVGSPKVIMYGSSQMDVFALDTNKVPYLDKWTPSGWSGWTSMGNYMASGASPAAIMYGSSEMDLFYRGGDNNIYKNTTFDGSSWGGFGSLGSPSGTTIVGNPSVLSYTAEGEYDIYVNTTSGHIYKRMWNGSWSGWADMGGGFVGNPYAMQYGSDMNLFARGTNNQIYHRYWSYGGQFWSGWGSLGGNLASDPYALQYGSSELDVFATGTDGNTDHDTFTPTNGWGGFSAL